MALIDKASLLMVPSTYEAGTLYNVLPSGNRAPDNKGGAGYDQTRADFTFDRGSNAAATRIGSDGLIKKYRENLFTNSNMFTGISLDGITRTTAQADPFGGSNAVLFTENTNTGTHRWYNTTSITSSAVYTISVFAKANGVTDLQIAGAAGIIGRFDLSTGEAFTSGIGIDAKIESIGTDGWYRCSATYNGGGWIGLYLAQGTSIGYTGDGTSGVYAYGYQAETGLVATDYLDSGATTGKAGVLIDLPRINYDANGENGSLLLEPQRTNDIPHSEYLNAVTKSNVTITTNAATSPEGNKNAHNVVANATNSDHLFFQSSMGGSTNANTQTIYAKANGYDWIHIRFDLPTKRAFFNVANGTLGTADSGVVHTIENAGNGWYRCSATMTTTNYANAVLGLASADATANFLGDGTSGVLMYGWQSEEASYATSYIPNHGTSGGVTRAADSMSTTPTDLLGSTTGSWFMELNDMTFEIAGTSVPTIYLGDDTQNCLALEARNSGNNKTIYLVKEEGGAVTTLHAFTISGTTKFCFVWNGTTLKVFRDGAERYSSTSFTQPTNWDLFVFNSTSREAFSEIANIQLYDTGLSDSEAETLTTL